MLRGKSLTKRVCAILLHLYKILEQGKPTYGRKNRTVVDFGGGGSWQRLIGKGMKQLPEPDGTVLYPERGLGYTSL